MCVLGAGGGGGTRYRGGKDRCKREEGGIST